MWDFHYAGTATAARASFFYSYWDRGEQLPLYYEGTAKTIMLSHRVEKESSRSSDGDMFRGEKRKNAFGVEVDAPFDARGIMLLTYRYKDRTSRAPRRRTTTPGSTCRRCAACAASRPRSAPTRSPAPTSPSTTCARFDGIVPQYDWKCLGEKKIIAPMNTKVKAYPYEKDHNFGPYGLSFANDRWELRDAVIVRMKPKNADHPYHHKDIYIDKQTLRRRSTPSPTTRRKSSGRSSGTTTAGARTHDLTGEWYKGWDGVAKPRDMRIVSRHHRERADRHRATASSSGTPTGTPLESKGKIRRYIDVGRLTKGR